VSFPHSEVAGKEIVNMHGKVALTLLAAVVLTSWNTFAWCKERIPVVIQRDPNGIRSMQEVLKAHPVLKNPESKRKYSIIEVTPDPNVDYSIIKVAPDPKFDYSMIIVEPESGKMAPDLSLEIAEAIHAASPSWTGRPSSWAQPIQLEGVPNLHKVSDSLYRSAQPTSEGIRNLKKMGIETIINLRSFHSDRKEIGDTGLAYEHLYMKAWHPEEKEAVRFLQIVTDPARTPVLVHCQHGADRTGTMCAIYRIAVQGWSKEEALQEMTKGGFGYHKVWINLPDWLQELDIEAIKSKAGIKSATE